MRQRIRRGEITGHTSGLAPGCVQGNVVILPQALAARFPALLPAESQALPACSPSARRAIRRCRRSARTSTCASDVPRYRVFRNGELVEEPTDIRHLWRGDLVTFILGCSFSFEWALLEDGLTMRHMAQGRNVPMYRTNVPTTPAGPFHGPLVVSMRSFKPADAIRAIQITSRFPGVHGAPVHIGLPEQIGIRDIAQARLGRRGRGAGGRTAAVLGLRRDAAGGDRRGEAGVLHHARARLDAGDRPEEQPTVHFLIRE